MNDYLTLPVVSFCVLASIFYLISVNAYSGYSLGIIVFSLLSIIVIFFNDNDQIIKNY